MGVTDYSLLIGVRNMQYDIDTNSKSNSSTSPTNNPSSGSGKGKGRRRLSSHSNNSSFSGDMPFHMAAPHPTIDLIRDSERRNNTVSFLGPNLGSFSTADSDAGGDEGRPNNADNYNADNSNTPKERVGAMGIHAYPARAVIAPSEYYLGVIDILQTWSFSKWAERIIKVYLLNQPPEGTVPLNIVIIFSKLTYCAGFVVVALIGVSCMAPEGFKTRFQQKVSRIIEHSIFVREVTGSWFGKR